MSKKSLEERFSIEMDAYFNKIQNDAASNSKEYNDIMKLGKTLADKDFSKKSDKEKVFENINKYKGEDIMKSKNRKFAIKVASIGTACALCGAIFMQTASAHELVDKIVKSISLGHITVVQEQVKPISKKSAKDKSAKQSADPAYLYEVKNSNDIDKYTCFKINMPSCLPEGYEFDKANVYKESSEVTPSNSKYVDLYFVNKKNGKSISTQERFEDQTTKYAAGTEGIVEKVNINGADAVLSDGKNLDWEAGGVLYGISSHNNISKSELIKFAESFK